MLTILYRYIQYQIMKQVELYDLKLELVLRLNT